MTLNTTRKTDREIRTIALDALKGKVFSNIHLGPPYDNDLGILSCIFLPISGLSDEEIENLVQMDLAMIYEYYNKAVASSNNYPIFTSMETLTKEEYNIFLHYLAIYDLNDTKDII